MKKSIVTVIILVLLLVLTGGLIHLMNVRNAMPSEDITVNVGESDPADTEEMKKEHSIQGNSTSAEETDLIMESVMNSSDITDNSVENDKDAEQLQQAVSVSDEEPYAEEDYTESETIENYIVQLDENETLDIN